MSLGALRGPIAQIIGQFGEPATLRRTTSHYDIDQGSTVTTKVDHPMKVVPWAFEDRLVDGSAVLATDTRFILPALDIDPAPGHTGSNDTQVHDTLIVGGTQYMLHRVKPYRANGVSLGWEVHARR